MSEKVGSTAVYSPEFGTCCQRGHISLSLQSHPPETLYRLLENNDDEGKEYCSNIWQYNMALTFTSLRVSKDKTVNHQGGWVFHVQGELCHLIGSLHPDENRPPSYAQLYIYDACLALEERMNRNDNLHADTMQSLQTMLLQFH